MSNLSALASHIRHVAERLAGEVTAYQVVGTHLNRDNARACIARLRSLADEVEQGINEREQAMGRQGEA